MNKQKRTPIAVLHRKIQTGMHRFTAVAKIDKHWSKLFTLFDTNPEWEDFLTDKGAGDAPVEYLVAVEEGLRSFGTDQAAFGKYAMDSLQEWIAVSKFKKRECYIAMARHRLGLGGYAKYQHFLWKDYVSRSEMTKAFDKRHWPYSNGSQALRISNPWENPVDRRHQRPKFNRGRRGFAKVPEQEEQHEAAAAAAAAAPSMEYDSETGEWTNLDGSDNES